MHTITSQIDGLRIRTFVGRFSIEFASAFAAFAEDFVIGC